MLDSNAHGGSHPIRFRTARPFAASVRIVCLTLALAAACSEDPSGPDANGGTDDPPQASLPACEAGNASLILPTGFCATIVADNVGTARHIVVAANGDVYIAINSTTGGGVLALRDTTRDGRADLRQTFGASGANGIAIYQGRLYVAYASQIVRYALTTGGLVPTGTPEVVVSGLPTGGDHQLKNLAFDGRGAMYVNFGSASNSCQVSNRATGSPGKSPCDELPVRAGIWRFDAAAINQTLASGTRYATGFRNTEALRYDSVRAALYGLPHGRDELSEDWPAFFTQQQQADLPAEELHRIDQGDDAGWPTCFYDGLRNVKVRAPEYGGNGTVTTGCDTKKQPLADYPGHWAPNDILFYYGTQFPARYRGGMFIAFHGGHDRAPLPNEGYNVAFVPFTADQPSQTFETFANGFTGGGTPLPANAAHRPMGLATGPDGSLYITDDRGGRIYRISYRTAN